MNGSALPAVGPVLRTPDACFADLPDFPWPPRFTEVGGLRIACIDAGPRDGPAVLLMHGEPTWSFLYRKMIPVLVDAGLRAIAPDLVGFGRSDKPARASDYSYANQVDWMNAWLRAEDLRGVTLFCQDWGSLIGLRMAAENPERFDRIVLSNGGLPTGAQVMPPAFRAWRAFARWSPWFPIGRIVAAGCARGLGDRERAAYDAPFPDRRHRIAARVFPGFVPASPDDPSRAANERAWGVFREWGKPFLTLFGTRDPITRGGEAAWQREVPGARGLPHRRIRGAGHFIQEDAGEELAREIISLVRTTRGAGGPA
ncbi:MAG: haloalkane dehalogenase [Burkholderiales bacterium]